MATNPLSQLSEYDLRHLLAHLEETGQVEDIHRVLALEYPRDGGQRHNAWFERKDELGELSAYVDDVRRAWRCAGPLSLQIRYALASASINSRTANVPPALLAAQVAHGQVPWEKAFASIQQMPESSQQARAVQRLAPVAPGSRQRRLLEVAQTIRNDSDAATAICALIPLLDDEGLHRAEGVLQHLPVSAGRSAAYLALANRVDGDAYAVAARQALSDALESADPGARAEALSNVAPLLAEPSLTEVLERALDAAMSVEKKITRAETVARLMPTLARTGHLHLARQGLDGWGVAHYQHIVMRGLIPFLSGADVETLAETGRTKDKEFPLGSYWWVVPYMTEPPRGELLRTYVQATSNDETAGQRLRRLCNVMPHLDAPLLEDALTPILEEPNSNDGEFLAAWCARACEIGLALRALEIAPKASDATARGRALAVIAPYLPEGSVERRAALNDALQALAESPNRARVYSALDALTPVLLPDMLPSAAGIVSRLEDAEGFDWAKAVALSEVSPAERPALLEHVQRDVLARPKSPVRAFTLVALFDVLADAQQRALLPAIYDAIAACNAEYRQVLTSSLASTLTPDLLAEAPEVMRERDWSHMTARAFNPGTEAPADRLLSLAMNARNEDEASRTQTLAAAREIAAGLEVPDNDDDRDTVAMGLAMLSQWMPEPEKSDWLRRALSTAAPIYRYDLRARVLNDLASSLPEPLLREAIGHALAMDEGGVLMNPRGFALRALLPALAELGHVDDALDLINRINEPLHSAIVLHLVVQGRTEAVNWRTVVSALGQRQRSHVLAAMYVLIPVLVAAEGAEGVRKTLAAIRDIGAWWP